MARLVDILVVDDRAVEADAPILALKSAAPTARVLRLAKEAEALSYLFGLDHFAGHSPSLRVANLRALLDGAAVGD